MSLPDAYPPVIATEGSTAFQSHILSLLSVISQHPSPDYPFPSSGDSTLQDNASVTAKKNATLSTFPGKKTPAEDAIERAIIALGDRVWTSERTQAHLVKDVKRDVPAQPGSDLLTPDWTPPVPTLNDSSPALDLSDSWPSC